MAPISERPAMAEYGVPDGPEGLLPWAWAEERLVACRNYWVVTASPDARPHAMPVWGVWLPEADAFWFGCASTARKARNLRANPAMVVTIDSTVEVVSIEGRAREAVADEVDAAVVAVVAKYAEPGGEDDMATFMRTNPFFVMMPERGFGIIEREEEFAARATRWRWT